MSLALIRASIIAALGGLLFGFDTAVISGTENSLREIFSLDDNTYGFTVAIALIGTIIGAVLVKYPCNSLGRKPTLSLLAVLYTVSAIGSAFPWDWHSFLFFRFIGGLGVGGASVVSPMYIAEISPAKIRGRLVALTQFNIVFGILLAYFSNYLLANMNLGDITWRLMFGVEAIPAILFFLFIFGIPESPRWLVAKGRSEEACKILAAVGTDSGMPQEEIDVIQKAILAEERTGREAFFCKKYRFPIMLAIAIAMFNQLSGINAILYYAPRVFEMAGADKDNAMFQSIIIGFVNLVFTMLALVVIDKFGRKKLMLVGSFGYIISLGAAAFAFYTMGTEVSATTGRMVLGALVLFIASHAFGQGAVIWVFISEIFPNKVRAQGQALGSFTHWVMAAAVSWSFPVFAQKLGPGNAFAIYCVMMVIQLIWVLTVMPETKQISLEDMQKKLGVED